MKNVYFYLYTPLNLEIRPCSSVRNPFCSFLFFGQKVNRNVFQLLLSLSVVTRKKVVARQIVKLTFAVDCVARSNGKV